MPLQSIRAPSTIYYTSSPRLSKSDGSMQVEGHQARPKIPQFMHEGAPWRWPFKKHCFMERQDGEEPRR